MAFICFSDSNLSSFPIVAGRKLFPNHFFKGRKNVSQALQRITYTRVCVHARTCMAQSVLLTERQTGKQIKLCSKSIKIKKEKTLWVDYLPLR